MTVKEPKPSDADPAAAPGGKPEQALSGGGSDTHAGSDEGGSAYGDGREDDKADERTAVLADSVEGPAEDKTFASPDGQEGAPGQATQTVTNTGEPRPVKNREGVEGQPGDDVDAATG